MVLLVTYPSEPMRVLPISRRVAHANQPQPATRQGMPRKYQDGIIRKYVRLALPDLPSSPLYELGVQLNEPS
jgi:hypothetical protein